MSTSGHDAMTRVRYSNVTKNFLFVSYVAARESELCAKCRCVLLIASHHVNCCLCDKCDAGELRSGREVSEWKVRVDTFLRQPLVINIYAEPSLSLISPSPSRVILEFHQPVAGRIYDKLMPSESPECKEPESRVRLCAKG
jgi:hypothetical protein